MKNLGRIKLLFLIDEMRFRTMIVITHYEQKQENVIYFTARYIFDNSIFNITSEKRLKFSHNFSQ